MAITALPAASYAQQGSVAPRKMTIVQLARSAGLPPRDGSPSIAPVRFRDYRIDPSLQAGRSAHSRAVDEMNAINTRRPRAFRFRPVMALTVDAADIDGPARMTGIAPDLMGMKRR